MDKGVWLKNWSGHWKVAFASNYGAIYTKSLKKYVGKNLDKTLLICEKDSSSNFIEKKDLDKFCYYLVEKIRKDPTLTEKWCKDTLTTANSLLQLLTTLKSKKEYSLHDVQKIKEGLHKHMPPHFSIKKVADYLPKKLLENVLPRLIQVRVATENLFNQVDTIFLKIAACISKKSGYSTKLLELLTITELEEYFSKRKLPARKDLEKRINGVALMYIKGKEQILVEKEFDIIQKSTIQKNYETIKGMPGYKGIAQGIVRIIFDPHHVKRFNRGDVLVTGMTRPEFLPLMEKAAAFVTDAGGILSHAAIVARELKKPCILGTQNATKVLKDGDLIEVDAYTGIVKKIKK